MTGQNVAQEHLICPIGTISVRVRVTRVIGKVDSCAKHASTSESYVKTVLAFVDDFGLRAAARAVEEQLNEL